MVDRQSSSNPVGAARSEPKTKPMDVLREQTSDWHQRVENAINWQLAFNSLGNYRRLLTAFAGAVEPIETRIAELLDPSPPGYRPSDRSQWLRHDLTALDALIMQSSSRALSGEPVRPIDVGPIDVGPMDVGPMDVGPMDVGPMDVGTIDVGYLFDQSGAIGALYVLEGSTLGGQILLRQLQSSLPAAAACSGRYFASRGSQTVNYWRTFTTWANQQLEQLVGTDAAVQAARETFRCFGTVVDWTLL